MDDIDTEATLGDIVGVKGHSFLDIISFFLFNYRNFAR
jgi:hypothetical protein